MIVSGDGDGLDDLVMVTLKKRTNVPAATARMPQAKEGLETTVERSFNALGLKEETLPKKQPVIVPDFTRSKGLDP